MFRRYIHNYQGVIMCPLLKNPWYYAAVVCGYCINYFVNMKGTALQICITEACRRSTVYIYIYIKDNITPMRYFQINFACNSNFCWLWFIIAPSIYLRKVSILVCKALFSIILFIFLHALLSVQQTSRLCMILINDSVYFIGPIKFWLFFPPKRVSSPFFALRCLLDVLE